MGTPNEVNTFLFLSDPLELNRSGPGLPPSNMLLRPDYHQRLWRFSEGLNMQLFIDPNQTHVMQSISQPVALSSNKATRPCDHHPHLLANVRGNT